MVLPSYLCFTILKLKPPSPNYSFSLQASFTAFRILAEVIKIWSGPSYSRQIRRKVSVSKESRRLGLGIFCGVWKRLNVPWSLLSLSPSIRKKKKTRWKTLGGGRDASVGVRNPNPEPCVLNYSQIQLWIIASFNSVPPNTPGQRCAAESRLFAATHF